MATEWRQRVSHTAETCRVTKSKVLETVTTGLFDDKEQPPATPEGLQMPGIRLIRRAHGLCQVSLQLLCGNFRLERGEMMNYILINSFRVLATVQLLITAHAKSPSVPSQAPQSPVQMSSDS